MVLTRANLEKTRKRRNNIYVSWKLFKVKWQRNTIDKQLTQVEKTLKRMESHLAVSRSVNETFQNWIISLGKQCWKNKQYSGREYIEIVGISDTTNGTKVCELIETATGISITITPDSLEACHCLPSHFQEEKMLKWFYQRKTKLKLQSS